MSISVHKTVPQNHTNLAWFYPSSSNGKEKDYESGFHYYGARYYWSEGLAGWLSVDPMADKYPSISPYAYCVWNPVKLMDPDGRDTIVSFDLRKPNEKKYKAYYSENYTSYYNKALITYKRNTKLAQNARQYNNTSDIIHVFAHGLNDAFGNYSGNMLWGNGEIVGPYELRSILNGPNGSVVFKYNLENNRGSVIMLHSCNAGKGFAQELSGLIPNSLIIAPSDNRSILSRCGWEFVENGGEWLFFYNGTMIYSHLGDFFSTFILEKNLELLRTDGVLEETNNNTLGELFK